MNEWIFQVFYIWNMIFSFTTYMAKSDRRYTLQDENIHQCSYLAQIGQIHGIKYQGILVFEFQSCKLLLSERFLKI